MLRESRYHWSDARHNAGQKDGCRPAPAHLCNPAGRATSSSEQLNHALRTPVHPPCSWLARWVARGRILSNLLPRGDIKKTRGHPNKCGKVSVVPKSPTRLGVRLSTPWGRGPRPRVADPLRAMRRRPRAERPPAVRVVLRPRAHCGRPWGRPIVVLHAPGPASHHTGP